MFFAHFSILISCIYVASAQFYYMVPPPTPAATYYSSFGNNAQFPYAPPAAAMSFFSRSFGPSQAYYSTQQTFGSGPVPPIGYQTFQDNNLIDTPVGIQQPSGAHVPTNTIYSTGPTDQFRGFAYHTQLTNGGSANVFFVTGPEAHQIRQHQGLLPVNNVNNTGNKVVEKAKSLASNTVDSNATDKNQQQQITETLSGPPPGPAFEALRSFLQNPQIGFQQFYASNGQLFAKTEQPNLNVPANTVLLPPSASIQTFGNLPFINAHFNTILNTTANKITEKDDKTEEVAESMNADVRVAANTTSDSNTSTQETITVSSTTVSLNDATSSTTEQSNKEATTKEESTAKKSRSVKAESDKTNEPSTEKAETSSTTTKIESTKEEASTVQSTSTTQSSSTTKKN